MIRRQEYITVEEAAEALRKLEKEIFYGDTTFKWKEGRILAIVEFRETKNLKNRGNNDN